MAELTEQQREFLQNPFFGVATTLRKDGSPHSTVVWVDVDEEGVSFNTAYGRRKPRNLERDPRATLTVVDPEDGHRWLSISGTARLVEEGAVEQIDRLSHKYRGRPYDLPPGQRRVTVRITPKRIHDYKVSGAEQLVYATRTE
jgi:PPOX class probable F420-dependent enzyme